jgi:hypothetical protein
MYRPMLGLALAMMAYAGRANAQKPTNLTTPKPRVEADSIPKEYLPPAGMCRIWLKAVPAARQPAPTDCATAIRRRPPNGRVVFGPELRDTLKRKPGE